MVCVQAEKVMKALYVRKLYLWPRFQATVRHTLEEAVATPADVSPANTLLHVSALSPRPLPLFWAH